MTAKKSVDQADIRQFPTAQLPTAKTFAPGDAPETNEAPQNERTQPHAVPNARPQEAPHKDTAKGGGKKSFGKRVVLPGVLIVAVAAGLWYGYDYWTVGRFMVSTDDAYVQGDIASIAPKVTGYIDNIPVAANQRVKAGDVIFQLDPGDYQIALDEAEAKLSTQKETLARIVAQTTAAQATQQQAEAQKQAASAVLTNAQSTLTRVQKLHETRFVAQADLDTAQSSLDQARANVANADAQIASAKANIDVLKAQYKETDSGTKSLELARDKAARDLAFTTLRAPFDGVVGNLSGKKGDLVSPGQKIAALVPVGELYIDANYKETQLAEIKTGETAHIYVDAIDGTKFDGKVVSVAPASGAVFSLLPPENATGNFTKVVQRVPVRIAIPQDALDSGKIRAGLSVIVDIDTRTAPEDKAN
ncbi:MULTISPECIES: HlyD family secretion protein [Ochrobactrum]|uniref:HlyD family secretion protein n=2 Tax=Ochrobactrum TaxID=528 RepID=A0ABD5JUE9_9HYPH|nr:MULTISPECIES: HlyD family secretion protein [Brucella]MCI0998784.1 HlyD family secretion protein [Ochrobactrum sp. C6C9]NNU60500.1 HlyD family secretion protein [[Ochrobactrum] soli]RRD26781.1 HlyD family secretion protein [Brucellaceae bacterium VT-16-1752]TNV16532.1 HlyD family secretion protein [[Ochrobactrum] teleogrylli]